MNKYPIIIGSGIVFLAVLYQSVLSNIIFQPPELNIDITNGIVPAENRKNTLNLPYASYQEFINNTPSLADTHVDGTFEFDDQGKLVLTKEIRNIFEYFYSALGEQSLIDIRTALAQYSQGLLSNDEYHYVMALYDNYLKARRFDAPADTEEPSGDTLEGLVQLQDHLSNLKSQRRQYLSAQQADVFFSDQEAYDDFSINRLIILKNDNLSDTEKKNAISILEYELPQDQLALRQSINDSKNLDIQVAELREKSASEEEIFQARSQVMGSEKAERLRQYEEQQQLWFSRLQQFETDKNQINNNDSLSAQDKEQQKSNLLQQNFNSQEIREIERIANVF